MQTKQKKRNPKSKLKDEMGVIQNFQNVLDLREKFFSILISGAKYKAKYGKRLKILSLQ